MPRKPGEPSVEVRRYELVDGTVTSTYSVRYFDSAGKRRRRTCASLEEADFERARVVLQQSDHGASPVAAPEPASSGLTVAAFWHAWIADARTRLQRTTIKEYERVFRVRLAPRFGALPLDAIRPRMVSQWRAELVAANTGPEAIRRAMTLLQAMYAVAIVELKIQKTGRIYRTVDLLPPLAADLAQWIAGASITEPDALVFARSDGQPWKTDDWNNWRNRRFFPSARAAGLGRPRPYDLRHSFASLLIREQRTSIVELADQLGHAPTMTLNTYAHVFAEHRREQCVDIGDWIERARAEAGRDA